MLLGTTWAWFTENVSTNNNIIQSGNLDVELEYWTNGDWEKVTAETNVFKAKALWEPGYTEVVYLKVSNLGSLALKYQLGVNVASETEGINVLGNTFKLSDYIEFGVKEDKEPEFSNYAEARKEVEGNAKSISKGYSKSSYLEKTNDAEYIALVVYMPESVGNEANHKTGTNAPVINLGINLMATQYTYEVDGSGSNQFDKDAPWVGGTDTTWYNDKDQEFVLDSAEQLAGLAELVNNGNNFEGKVVKLGANVDLNNVAWTPIGISGAKFNGSFYGNEYTISNLYVVGSKGVGLFGYVGNSAHLEGVIIDGAYVSGNDYVGAVMGTGYLRSDCLKYCTVTNATVVATPYKLADGTYDGGAKAGVVAGYVNNGHIIGNTAKDSTVIAYRDLGGIAGMGSGENYTMKVEDNTVENVTLSYVGVIGGYDANKGNQNMNEIVGRENNIQSANNKATNVTKEETGAIVIYTVAELVEFANAVNSGNSYKGKTVLLGADIDLGNREWTPIGTGDGFKGTFDGNGKTISNLKITGKKSTVGLFANTYDGEIKNLTVENASVSGDLHVGVVAGNPYTSKYTNITVKGHVEVNGSSYVGGVGGKNAYANWTDITVDVDDTSYVKAISTEYDPESKYADENGYVAYRTYVGGVVGFNGEGNHTFKNITSNIDVIGDVCDIGGVFGIAHYNNNFENITCTGNVTNLVSSQNDGDDAATDVLETGLIAGVWHNANDTTVTFKNISATGTISTPNITPADDFANKGLVGKQYSATGTGVLIITNYVDEDGITYANDVITGDKTLYLVPADYEGDTVNVPEGVDAIGNYAFAYNSNVKDVVLSSTVRDLGRAFDSSTVEKVVLNEGLETISSRAFRSTTALKEVVISSTVTEIADNAFQKSGIKEIVIPATVKTIGETAFGASLIEKVTFEGDIAIQGYAFRGCTKLHTVVMNGYDVTFVKSTLNGRESMWFCNGESNNPDTSDIDFYVKNEVIKERVLTAMGAERNNTDVFFEQTADENGNYTDSEGNTYNYASDDTTLNTAISNGAKTVYLSSGNYIIPSAAKGKEGLTFVGTGDTSVAVTKVGTGGENCDYGLDGSTVTFENITITTNSSTYIGYARCNATYNNCTINGTYTLYGNSVFNNCEFNVSGDVYNLWTWGAPTATFNNCTFNSDGKALLLYGTANTKLTLNDCTFNDNGGLTDLKAAVEIGNDYGKSYELIVNNATVNGYEINDKGINTGSTLWANKNSMGTDVLNVVIDGVDVY
jgi:hypothetical protein